MGRGGGQSSFRLPNTAAGTLCCSRRTSGWGRGVRRTWSLSGRGSRPHPPPHLAHWPLTVGLQVHLILILVFSQLNLLRVGLLGQLSQLLPRGVTPGAGGGHTAQPGRRPPTSRRLPSWELAGPEPWPQGAPSPHEQDLALGPGGLVPLSLRRQLLGTLLQ